MSRIQTMGTSSCACIAISGFKEADRLLEERFLEGTWKEPSRGKTVDGFYSEVLYPTTQELGRTKNYPFTLLMDLIDESAMGGKFTIAVLAAFQRDSWEHKLEERGFKLIDKTDNEIGTTNYIYTRNNNRVG